MPVKSEVTEEKVLGKFDDPKTLWVLSNTGKPVILVDGTTAHPDPKLAAKGEYFCMSISQEMVEKNIPCPVPANAFFAGYLQQKILKAVNESEAKPIYDKWLRAKKAAEESKPKPTVEHK